MEKSTFAILRMSRRVKSSVCVSFLIPPRSSQLISIGADKRNKGERRQEGWGEHGQLASRSPPPFPHLSIPLPPALLSLPWLIPFRPLSPFLTPRLPGSVWRWHREGAGGTQTATQMGNGQCRAASPHLLLAGTGLGPGGPTVRTHTHTNTDVHLTRNYLSQFVELSHI